MTHNQLPIETSNGWTGFFEAETSQETLRTQSKDEVHPEKPTDDSESSKYNNDEKNEDFRKMDEKDKNDKETDKEDGEQKVYCLDYCCCRFFPRISLLFVGIFFPLWTLISISTLFGFALSAVESPQEGT